ELENTIQAFLTVTAKTAPMIIQTKPKFHFLLHLPMFIWRFGPALLFSTECYESFNSVFHLTIVHSNRMAPSRDLSHVFASLDHVRHIATGGMWFDPMLRRWKRASNQVLKSILTCPEYARLLGLDLAWSHPLGYVSKMSDQKDTVGSKA
ncbi:hypothetical protein K439DRAFT_1368666, partial [Ramaria rubella]